MKTIIFDIPEGYETLDIREMSVKDEYYVGHGQHYIEVDLIAKEDMCNIRQPHSGIDCPCNK